MQVLTKIGFKNLKTVNVGELISDENGEFKPLLDIIEQKINFYYKVTLSDKFSFICSEKTIIPTRTEVSKNNEGVDYLYIEEILKDFKSDTRYKYTTLINKAINFDKKDLLIPPYMMGMLLGDGSFRDSTIRYTSNDLFLIDKMEEILKTDFPTCNIKKVTNTKYDYRIAKNKEESKGKTPIRLALEFYNLADKLSKNKHIPKDYLYSSIEDRIELFQGLIDTDGTIGVGDGCVSYSTSSKELSNDFTFLCKSLGARVWVNTKKSYYRDKDGKKANGLLSYRTSIILPPNIIPCKLQRKLDNYNPSFKNLQKWIINIEKIEENVYFYKPIIDSDNQLYISDNFIILHN